MDAQDSAVIPEGYTILASNAVRAKEVVLPSSMRHLSADCFAVNGNPLQTIVLNDGLQTIGARAFASTQIEEITIPDSVTFIGKDALSGDQLACATIPFLGCTPQSSGTLDETFGSGLMALKDLTITCEMESIPRLLPLGVNSSIQSITFSGDHCSRIEDYAFYQMYHLEEVQIPEGCTSIGDYAFLKQRWKSFLVSSSWKRSAHMRLKIRGLSVCGFWMVYAVSANRRLLDVICCRQSLYQQQSRRLGQKHFIA